MENFKFSIPDSVKNTLTAEEVKGMEIMGQAIVESLKGNTGDLSDKVMKRLEDAGISAETIKRFDGILEEQGKTISKLKEQATAPARKIASLKSAFDANFEGLQKAIREGRSDFSIKAIDEHNPDLIHTTANTVTTTTGASLFETEAISPDLFLKRHDREYIHDIANVSRVAEVPETYTFYEEGDEEGNIAIVAENGLKPQIHLSLVKNKAEAKKAAGYIVVTEEVVKWRTRTWAAIQRLFRDKVYRDYENLLTTDLGANVSQYVSTPLDGTITNPTNFDAIIAAILQGEMLNFKYDTLVINPADKWQLALTTVPNGGMFILPFLQQNGQFSLLGLRVITTNKVPAGTFIVGESGTWYVEEEAPRLRTGLVNDDLIHNRSTIIGEIFFLSYVPSVNAGAWVQGNFADIKEALSKA